MDKEREERASEILRRAKLVKAGFVTTYGDLYPSAPRFAGNVMGQSDDPDVPWHRIVRADGSLAQGSRQREKLEAEGVPFDGIKVDMAQAWMPVADPEDRPKGK
jgi:methylated-DNA-protein-cysteine methyltransferase related protein